MTTAIDGPGSIDPGLEALVTLLHFQGVAADREQIRHRLGGAPSAHRRCCGAPRISGSRPGPSGRPGRRLAGTPLPAIASLRDGGFLVLGKVGDDKVLVQSSQTAARVDDAGRIRGGLGRRSGPDDAPRRPVRPRAPLRHHLVPRRDPQVPASARRGAGRLVLPAALRAGLAAVLPGRHRQGAGASRP